MGRMTVFGRSNVFVATVLRVSHTTSDCVFPMINAWRASLFAAKKKNDMSQIYYRTHKCTALNCTVPGF